ncbi:MAG: hypothetical protein R2838_00300 [Caldilineaceae bacterium]
MTCSTPLIYVHELDRLTLTVGLSFFQNQYGGKWTLMMAETVVSILPILLVAFFFAPEVLHRGDRAGGDQAVRVGEGGTVRCVRQPL